MESHFLVEIFIFDIIFYNFTKITSWIIFFLKLAYCYRFKRQKDGTNGSHDGDVVQYTYRQVKER
jgi:hypothetical protein